MLSSFHDSQFSSALWILSLASDFDTRDETTTRSTNTTTAWTTSSTTIDDFFTRYLTRTTTLFCFEAITLAVSDSLNLSPKQLSDRFLSYRRPTSYSSVQPQRVYLTPAWARVGSLRNARGTIYPPVDGRTSRSPALDLWPRTLSCFKPSDASGERPSHIGEPLAVVKVPHIKYFLHG